MQYREVMRAERKVDCYGGDECDQHVAYFEVSAQGDKDSDTSHAPLAIDPKNLPAGAVVVVSVPVCPDCDCDAELCRCGFDWKQWAEDQYA